MRIAICVESEYYLSTQFYKCNVSFSLEIIRSINNPLFHFNFDIFFSYQKSSVLFNQDKLSVIHLYPSESSFLDETDSTGQFSKTEDAINNERLRMKTVDTDAPAVASQVETIENVNFVTEGGDFNSFSNDEEGASALLF